MKRTIKPHNRKNIKKQDISLDILEENQSLFVNIKINNLSDYEFSSSARIYLEAFNNINIDHIYLGNIKSFEPKNYKKLLRSFIVSQRSKIKFRLKITDTKTWRLLGLAERLKERKYTESLLPIEITDKISTIFKIDWGDIDHPILLINQELRECLKDIKPILVTAVFREILLYLLLKKNYEEDLEDHKWFNFAKKYKSCPTNLHDNEEKINWIENVLDEFSKKHKIIKNLKRRLEQN